MASVIAVITGVLFTLLRINSNSRSQKKLLAHANNSHKKELAVIKDAKKSLEKGLLAINQKEKEAVDTIEKEAIEKLNKLQVEKQDFISDKKSSKELAEDLANILGADFVDSSED